MRTARRPWSSSTLAVLVVAVVLAACGGDDGADPDVADSETGGTADDPADADDPRASRDGDTDAGDAGPDGADQQAGPEEPVEDLSDGLDLEGVRGLLEGVEQGPAQVTYELEGDLGFGNQATMTIAQDPPRLATLVEAEQGAFLTIVDGSASVTCFAEGADWQCLDTSSDVGNDDLLEELPGIEDLDLESEPDRLTRETIVGRSAICLGFDELDDLTDAVTCFDEETGALLRSSGTSGDGVRYAIEAVEFRLPDPAIFEPPAEPMDLGSMMGQG